MQDARNEDASTLLAIEYNVLAMRQAAQARTNVITPSAQCRIVRERLATQLKVVDIAGGLGFAPCMKCVIADAQQVGLSTTRKAKCGHG